MLKKNAFRFPDVAVQMCHSTHPSATWQQQRLERVQMSMFVQVKGHQRKNRSRWVVCQLNLGDCLVSCWSELSVTGTGCQDAGVGFPLARGGVPHLDVLVRSDLRLVSEFTRLYRRALRRPCVVSLKTKVSLHRHPLPKP